MSGSTRRHGRTWWMRLHRARSRKGLSLAELLTAVVLLGFGLIGLALGSGWMSRSGEAASANPARTSALRAAVEEVSAIPFEELEPGSRRYGGFDVEWTFEKETPTAVLLRFIVSDADPDDGIEDDSTQVADTLEYRRTRR